MTTLDRLSTEIAREQDEVMSRGDRLTNARRRLLATDVGFPRRRVPAWVGWAVAGTGAMAVTTGAPLWHFLAPDELVATTGESNSPISANARLDAPENASIPVRFSDGTQIEVAPRSRMRLMSLGRRDVRLAMESGHAGFTVVHTEHRRWELRAGPFAVNITGTRFDVAWDPAQDRFDLALTEGQVELTGCGFSTGRRLVAGQTVRASCRDGSVEIAYGRAVPWPTELATASTEKNGPAVISSSVSAPKSANVTSPRGSTSHAGSAADAKIAAGASSTAVLQSSITTSQWMLLAEQGRFKDALAAVDRTGFAAECSRAQVDDLALLADTARSAREPQKARRAFLVLRQRFPDTSQAGVAAFKLGVLEFDQMGAYMDAASWFRTYLAENPSGPLTREARGRLMEAMHRAGSTDARVLAADYLHDYPTGPHAELAQRIVDAQ
jgi:transmembrane sensor